VIKVSNNGKYVASGQKTFMGFQADVIIWDFKERALRHRLKLHKVLIASLSFSYDSKYLASQGGLEDKYNNHSFRNMLIVWDVDSGKSLYGTPIKDVVNEVVFFNNCDNKLVAVLQSGVQILTIDKNNKKILSIDVNFGNVKRYFTCCAIDMSDTYCYVGTKTGDLFEISIEKAIYKRLGPVKKLFSLGINTLKILPNGDIIVGAGDGHLGKISIQNMQQVAEGEVLGAVSSITFTGDYSHFFCGTAQSNIYWVNATNLAAELRNTCHYDKINDVAFPANYSDVFATCSMNDIRIWNAKNRQELLRIQVPNLECNTVAFMYDGKSIISGWSDGKIRAFLPQSGNLLYCINDAHHHGVTAITATTDCQKVVSGGSEGEVRVWKIGKQTQTMEASLKEHRGRVWSIQVSKNNDQALSGSGDGSCIIWDLKTYTRIICLFESTLFKQVLFHPEEYQLLTTGSDRKITYWEKFDGQVIRKIDGSEEGELNALAITKEGEHFVTGGEDTILRVWGYDDGQKYYEGSGHSGAITKVTDPFYLDSNFS
jgi:WD40 repeat protein